MNSSERTIRQVSMGSGRALRSILVAAVFISAVSAVSIRAPSPVEGEAAAIDEAAITGVFGEADSGTLHSIAKRAPRRYLNSEIFGDGYVRKNLDISIQGLDFHINGRHYHGDGAGASEFPEGWNYDKVRDAALYIINKYGEKITPGTLQKPWELDRNYTLVGDHSSGIKIKVVVRPGSGNTKPRLITVYSLNR